MEISSRIFMPGLAVKAEQNVRCIEIIITVVVRSLSMSATVCTSRYISKEASASTQESRSDMISKM